MAGVKNVGHCMSALDEYGPGEFGVMCSLSDVWRRGAQWDERRDRAHPLRTKSVSNTKPAKQHKGRDKEDQQNRQRFVLLFFFAPLRCFAVF